MTSRPSASQQPQARCQSRSVGNRRLGAGGRLEDAGGGNSPV